MHDGSEAPAGTAGEIEVRGPNVTIGYLNQPEAEREAFYDGWFATGDIGYVDDEGFLYVLDRRKDLIISGGENIYPAEIEAVLMQPGGGRSRCNRDSGCEVGAGTSCLLS